MGQADQGHLEVDPRIGSITHVDLGPTQHLHGPDQRGQAHPFGPGREGLPLRSRHGHQLGGHQGQKSLTQVVHQVPGQLLGTEPCRRQVGHRHQGPTDVLLGQRFHHLVELGKVVIDRVRSRHLVEDRECVSGGPPAPPDGQVERLVGHVEVGVPAYLGQQLAQGLRPSSRNSKCWVRLRMVGSTFWGSVVASTKTTWAGGSSSVFSSALEAAVDSMWTSSTM